MPNAWKAGKRLSNLSKHGVDFADVERFEWQAARVKADMRHHYGEVRLQAIGPLDGRLHMLVYTIRHNSTWIISLRWASNREISQYEHDI